MTVDTSRWSGEGTFTQMLVSALDCVAEIAALRVEDAPASRADTGYNFVANELFVTFATAPRRERRLAFGVIPYTRKQLVRRMDLSQLAERLRTTEGIGEPDYADEGLIQYLRTERIVAPYQRKGIKVIELVRIYRAGTSRADALKTADPCTEN